MKRAIEDEYISQLSYVDDKQVIYMTPVPISHKERKPDERHWYTNTDGSGEVVYHDVDITANPRVQQIMLRAQANMTELGYWRDVATDLADLVDSVSKVVSDARYAMIDGNASGCDVPVSTVDSWLTAIEKAIEQ
jgi:hypothetical protein